MQVLGDAYSQSLTLSYFWLNNALFSAKNFDSMNLVGCQKKKICQICQICQKKKSIILPDNFLFPIVEISDQYSPNATLAFVDSFQQQLD
jgi:hypothetical protein